MRSVDKFAFRCFSDLLCMPLADRATSKTERE
uniref:Uncharacterized protein n=1 Tax=Parascaris equorum TaxID=6256 RepID=A0A914RP36_PAREQ